MQLIFKYDLQRLTSYSANPDNKIKILNEADYTMLSFPEVESFNYTFHNDQSAFTKDDLQDIRNFYGDSGIPTHKVLMAANCESSNELMKYHPDYKRVSTIAKTFIDRHQPFIEKTMDHLEYIKADQENIAAFTKLYLQGFEATGRDYTGVAKNFNTLLNVPGLDLIILRHNGQDVGINVLYNAKDETLLAGGAILPRFRNQGFHKAGLSFRIGQFLQHCEASQAIAWAYNPSISLNNMQKLNMQIQEEFNVYKYQPALS